jgi:hypothetical protein
MRRRAAQLGQLVAERLGLRVADAGAPRGPMAHSAVTQLSRELARSFDDGTAHGKATSAQFAQLCTVVSSVLGQHHHELEVRLQDAYHCVDPNEPPVPGRSADAHDAAAFSAQLHSLLSSAGFRLCSREDESRAMHGHFGNEHMWNVPVSMRWDNLDGTLVQAPTKDHPGGFDAYAAEEAAGRVVSRPSWAHKLTVYHRGVGTVEKRGHFVVAKIEEMLTRRARSVAGHFLNACRAAVRPVATRLDVGLSWAAEHAVLRSVKERLGFEGEGEAPAEQQQQREELHQQPRTSSTGALGHPAGKSPLSKPETGGEGPETQPQQPQQQSVCRSLQSVELSFRSLFDETTLTALTHRHVLLVYRHSDAPTEAHANDQHIVLNLYRNVPQSDLELLLPHIEVRMPELQRMQFGAFSVVGVLAGYPLLQERALSLTGVITLYTLAAFAARTAVRWRAAKQLYQQLLLSYQNSNRVGSADGALLCAARLSEEEQTKRALLSLHALVRAQQRSSPPPQPSPQPPPQSTRADPSYASLTAPPGLPVGRRSAAPRSSDGSLSVEELSESGRRVLGSWSQLQGVECAIDEGWSQGPLPRLVGMGLVETIDASDDAETEAEEGAQQQQQHGGAVRRRDRHAVRVRLRPLDEALASATAVWSLMASERGALDSPRSGTTMRGGDG